MEENLKNYKIVLAYDGTHYSGWQTQRSARTIQGIVEESLSTVLREKITVTGAGRTDAGVHACGQAAHFLSSASFEIPLLLRSLNGVLPRDIRVKSIAPVPVNFHACYSAVSKIYCYYLDTGSSPNPFKRLYSWHLKEKFDLSRLKEAAQYFCGTHDFTSFSNNPLQGSCAKNPVRTIHRIEAIPEGEIITLSFEGTGFLYKMVRNLTGFLVEVALGKRVPGSALDVLQARDRTKAAVAAPARGLFLAQVNYTATA